MGDIEDASAVGPEVLARMAVSALVNSRRRRQPAVPSSDYGNSIPGNATVFVYTFGCGHNVSDGEYMSGLLAEAGYRVTDVFDHADVYLLNSCTVKNPSEEHLVSLMNRVRATGRPLVIAGCVPQADPANTMWDDVSIVGVRSIDRVAHVVHEALQGNHVHLLGSSGDQKHVGENGKVANGDAPLPPLDLPKIRRNQFIEIVPISVGCLNNCTYCKTKQARGDLRSWPIDVIVARVRNVVRDGVKEIRLASEDVGAYGVDIGTDIVELLRAISSALEGSDAMIRVGMSNPPYLLRHVDAFAALLLHPNVYEFVHIPVQSGSNCILDAMRREYTVEEFHECVARIRRVVPKVLVATDIICAFPGEGEAEWRETMKLCDAIRFPVLNITRFYARRNTPAAAMRQITTTVAKKRTVELTTFFNSYTTYDSMVGEVHRIALLETAHDKHNLLGHTKGYVQVLVDPAEGRLGETVTVLITAASKYSVTGRVLRSRWDRLIATQPKRQLAVAAGAFLFLAAAAAVAASIGVRLQRRRRR